MPRRTRPLPDWVATPPRPPRTRRMTAWIDPAAVPTPRHLELVRALPVHRRVWLSPDSPEPALALPGPVLTVPELLAGPLSTLDALDGGFVILTGTTRRQAKALDTRYGPGRLLLLRCSRRAGLLDADADRIVDHCVRSDPFRQRPSAPHRSPVNHDAVPTLTPSTTRVPDRTSVSIDRRRDVSGAPEILDRLGRTPFTPVDVLLWVSVDTAGEGRWSVHLWGEDRQPTSRSHLSTQFDGPVRDGVLVVHHRNEPPTWVRTELDGMLTEVLGQVGRLSAATP